ncbi:EamA family transporter [Nocardioides korecus]
MTTSPRARRATARPAAGPVRTPPTGTGVGIAIALVSASSFATSGPVAKAMLETGWTPGSVTFLRVAGAALVLLVPTARVMRGRWHLLRSEWWLVVGYGIGAVATPQLAFSYAVGHLSVGVALLLEYLGLVLVVVWQAVAARSWPGRPTVVGVVLALAGLALVLDVVPLGSFGGSSVAVDLVGVAWGLLAAVGLASYYLLSGSTHETALPPLALAGGGLVFASVGFAVFGVLGLLPMEFPPTTVALGGVSMPWWLAVLELALVAAVTPYTTGIVAARILGPKLASFVGLSEVMFAVLFAWLLLGELPRAVQLVGGLFILAGVVVVRAEAGGRGASEGEAALAVGGPLGGPVPVVPDEGVEGDGVDVGVAQHAGRPVAAVQDQRPAR